MLVELVEPAPTAHWRTPNRHSADASASTRSCPSPTATVRAPRMQRCASSARTPSRIGRCSFSQRTSGPSYRSVTSGPQERGRCRMCRIPTWWSVAPAPTMAAPRPVTRVRTNGRSPCRTSSKRSWRRRAPTRPGPASSPASPDCRCRRPTAAWWCAPTRRGMFDGMATRDKDPRKSLHVQEVPTPELGPGEALVAVMASAINYNTVWTSIFEPLPTFEFLQRYGRLSELTRAARPAVPRGRLGRGRRGAAGRPGRDQVEARRRGGRALPLGRAGGRRRPRRHHARPAAADLGLRDQLRRPGRAGRGQGQPADAQAAPPDLGGGGQPRAGQLHRVPAARLAPRRQHEAGRRRADLGRLRRPRRLRHPDGAQRRRDPGLRGLLARRRPSCAGRWAPSWSSTGPPRASGSGRTSTPRTRTSGGASASGSAS